MSTEAHEPASPTWDALRKLGEQCPHPLKVEGECLIVLDSDRRRFTDLGTPEMAQFVLASVNYVRGILAQPASPVLHDEKDLASYWKAAHDLVVAQNWELSRQIDATSTPIAEGKAEDLLWLRKQVFLLCEEAENKALAELEKPDLNEHAQGFYRGKHCEAKGIRRAIADVVRSRIAERAALAHPKQAGAPSVRLYRAIIELRDHVATSEGIECWDRVNTAAIQLAALAHPQQGGERDGDKPEIVQHVKSKGLYEVVTRDAQVQTDTPLSDYAFVCVYRNAITGVTWVRPVSEMDDGRFVTMRPAAPTSPSEGETPDLSYSGKPMPPDGIEGCVYCGQPFHKGDLVLNEVEGGRGHITCMGPERDSYVGADGEPLKDGEPIPTGYAWSPTPQQGLGGES